MGARQSEAATRAVRAVLDKGWTTVKAAEHYGLALSTVHRALARERVRRARGEPR